MGLGLAALGRPRYINLGHASDLAGHTDADSMQRAAHAVLDAAYAGGVRYFDAARSYGKAEAFLATWLRRRGLGPNEVTVGSKWGYTYTANWRRTRSRTRSGAARAARGIREDSPSYWQTRASLPWN
jgi:aryl-alcohol dehydrogenase-like predicted oxidoreductase